MLGVEDPVDDQPLTPPSSATSSMRFRRTHDEERPCHGVEELDPAGRSRSVDVASALTPMSTDALHRARSAMKFGVSTAQSAVLRGRPRAPACSRTPRTGRLADSLGFDYVSEVEHHFLEDTATLRLLRFWPRCRRRIAYPSRPRRRARRAAVRPSGPRRGASPRSISSPAGESTSGGGSSSSEAELAGFRINRRASGRPGWKGSTTTLRCMVEYLSTASTASTSRCRTQRHPQPYQQPRPPLSVACGRRAILLAAAGAWLR